MVIKISKADNIGGVVGYNMDKVEEHEAALLDSWRIPVAYSKDGLPYKQEMVQAFQERAELNCRVKKSITHISLNPDPDDRPSDEQLAAMGSALLERLGYGDQPYIMVKHTDISRHHLHIVVSNINEKGEKIRDSFEKYRCNAIRRELEQEYNLKKAEESRLRQDEEKRMATVTDALRRKIDGVKACYTYGTYNDFRTLCELAGLNIIENPKEDGGAGLSYALSDNGDNGSEMPTPPVPAAQLGKEYGYEAICTQAKENADRVATVAAKPSLRKILWKMQHMENLAALHNSLYKLNLTLVFRRTVQGRVYGCTVIDNKNKAIMSASDIHRSLSAKGWQKFFPDEGDGVASFTAVGRNPGEVLAKYAEREAHRQRAEPAKDKVPALGRTAGTARMAPTRTALGNMLSPSTAAPNRAGGKVAHQEKANTWYRGDEDEEEEERKRRRLKQFD